MQSLFCLLLGWFIYLVHALSDSSQCLGASQRGLLSSFAGRINIDDYYYSHAFSLTKSSPIVHLLMPPFVLYRLLLCIYGLYQSLLASFQPS